MLTSITIHNFGLIDHLSIDCDAQVTMLTGETGAGKSIIIDALRYALGERLNSSHIRTKEKPCIVEASFQLDKTFFSEYPQFQEYNVNNDAALIIKRQTSPDGKNKAKINDFSVTVGTLKEIGSCMVDIHGPHDHQMLLSQETHLRILDRLSSSFELKNVYNEKFSHYSERKAQLRKLEESAQTRERDLELCEHTLRELETVPLNEKEYTAIMSSGARLQNTEKLYHAAQALLALFETETTGISEQISEAFHHLRILTNTDESTESIAEHFEALQERSDTLVSELTAYCDSLSFDAEDPERITNLCDAYHTILRKYGPTIEDAAQQYETVKKEYDLLINYEQNDADLRKEINILETELVKLARDMSKQRKESAVHLEKTMKQELKELGIKHVDFECRFEDIPLMHSGSDRVEFFISPNAGEPLKPLADIISSGEAARLMLALKKALTNVDPIPVLIFDEIDAQIGGRLGTITGKKLKALARKRQVIAITHLPQIAAFADKHLKVSKETSAGRTNVQCVELIEERRIDELAIMMSGEKTSETARKHAQEMIVTAKQ